VTTSRGAWPVAGLVAGFAGVATSYCVAMLTSVRDAPVVAVAELVIRLTPGPVAEKAIRVLGHRDKPFLVVMVLLISAVLFAEAGRLARRSPWGSSLLLGALAVLGGVAVLAQRGATAADLLPVVVGLVTWLVVLQLLAAPLRRREAVSGDAVSGSTVPAGEPGRADTTRRSFLLRAGAVVVAAVAVGAVGRAVGAGRRHVEEVRRLLRLPGVTPPDVPAGARVDVPGMTPWITPTGAFYRIDTEIIPPSVDPAGWELRVHGLVDHEVVLGYQDLVAKRITEAWVTLNCVSNEVGGELIGNAWWSGVRVADVLAMAGVRPGADAVLQTSVDGWTCGTPLSALTDDKRDAMLAIAMNGKPLPIEHGFPVRTIVPGLYGYVSACKWVVDLEVTRFADISAYWTERGWSELGPVKIASRIDVPASGGEISAGGGVVAGVAWAQHTGIRAVEVSVDDGEWQAARLADAPSPDTWVQWVATVDVEPGDHTLRVRATDAAGLVQTGEVRDVVPNGATGWHTIDLTATGGS
jgi:DMSO/TMAO reductase YedYZ molybdopterin-dependent catalytic subunit